MVYVSFHLILRCISFDKQVLLANEFLSSSQFHSQSLEKRTCCSISLKNLEKKRKREDSDAFRARSKPVSSFILCAFDVPLITNNIKAKSFEQNFFSRKCRNDFSRVFG